MDQCANRMCTTVLIQPEASNLLRTPHALTGHHKMKLVGFVVYIGSLNHARCLRVFAFSRHQASLDQRIIPKVSTKEWHDEPRTNSHKPADRGQNAKKKCSSVPKANVSKLANLMMNPRQQRCKATIRNHQANFANSVE